MRWTPRMAWTLTLFAVNVGVTLLLFYVVCSVLDTNHEFNLRVAQWQETGEYPFPAWLVTVMPRLMVIPVSAEVTYHLLQTLVWVGNGYLVRRHIPALQPLRGVWIPLGLNLLFWDPVQLVLGTAGFIWGAVGGSWGRSQRNQPVQGSA